MNYIIDISNSNYEINDDLIKIQLEKEETCDVNYTKFFSQSLYFKNTYNYSEGLNSIHEEINKIQRKHQIDNEIIKIFFQLIQQGQADISLENWKKIYFLSEYFNIPKFTHELNNFIKIKLYEDLGFTIQMLIDSNEENDFESKLTSQIEDFLTKRIDECFSSQQFSNLPVSTLYRIIEKAQQNVNHNLLIDFILETAEERFTLFLLVDYKKLTEEKRQKLFDFISKQNEEMRSFYLAYIKFDFNFIQIMNNEHNQLLNENNQIRQEVEEKKLELIYENQRIQELNQVKQKIDQGKSALENIEHEVERNKLELNEIKLKIDQEKTVLENTNQESEKKRNELNEIKLRIEQEKSVLENTNQEYERKRNELNDIKHKIEQEKSVLEKTNQESEQKRNELKEINLKIEQDKTVLENTKREAEQKEREVNEIKLKIEQNTEKLSQLSIQNMKRNIKVLYITVKNQTVVNFNFLNSLNTQNQEFNIQLIQLYEDDFMNIIKYQSQYLDVYDIVFIGGRDCYPSYSNLTQDVISNFIYKYHQNGGIILFLHTLIYDKYVNMFQQLTNLLGFRGVKQCGWHNMYSDVQFNVNSRKNDIISLPFSFVNKQIGVASTHINAQFNSNYTVLYHDNIDNPYYSENIESRIANCEIGHSTSINQDEQKLFYNIICHLYRNCKNLNN